MCAVLTFPIVESASPLVQSSLFDGWRQYRRRYPRESTHKTGDGPATEDPVERALLRRTRAAGLFHREEKCRSTAEKALSTPARALPAVLNRTDIPPDTDRRESNETFAVIRSADS